MTWFSGGNTGGDDQSQQTTSTAQLLMRGRLRQISTGDLHVDDEGKHGPPEGSMVEIKSPSNGNANGTSAPGQNNIDFLQDDPSEMTWGRRIALSLMNKKWYNPRADEGGEDGWSDEDEFQDAAMEESPLNKKNLPFEDDDDDADNMFARTSTSKPNLKKAWAYFEHVALDRYIVQEKETTTKKNVCHRMVRKFQKADKKLDRAEPGENDFKTRLYSPIYTPHKQLGDFGLGIGLYFSTLRAIALITFLLGLVSVYNINYFASDSYMPEINRTLIETSLIRGSAVCTNTRK